MIVDVKIGISLFSSLTYSEYFRCTDPDMPVNNII